MSKRGHARRGGQAHPGGQAGGVDEGRRYLLRRTLFPWKVEETIEEAARFAREFGIDEIIWKIDTEEFSHGLPTLERIERYVPWLAKSRERLAKVGVSMSINPWVTQGMRDAGWDLRATFPDFEWMTDISGVQARSQACPLSPAWRRWLRRGYELYASTRPRVLWIEDDIRIHGHRPVRFACFCERHLDAFSARVGRRLSREELAAEVLRPGAPSPLRAQWLDFLGQVIADVVRDLAAVVYVQGSTTMLGLMCSAPWAHGMECRHWDALLEALAGPHPFVTIRPAMGNYEEATYQGLYGARQLVSGTLRCVRRPVHACTEVENFPFSRWSKSVRFTRAQLLLSAALRCPTMTLNLYDHVGTPLYDEPQYGQMLRALRPRLDALAAAYGPDGRERGVGILHHEYGAKYKRLAPGANYGDLSLSGEPWSDVLQAFGLPVSWSESDAVAVSGKKFEAYEDRLDELFSRSVLLDLSAVESLLAMGRGDLVGVELAETFIRAEKVTPAEEPTEAAFGGAGGRYMTVDQLGLAARVGCYELKPGARAVSRLVNSDREPVMPGFVVFENRLGGRVALCPYDLSGGMRKWFMNWLRRRQMRGISEWLFRARLPLCVEGGAYALPIRTDYSNAVLVSAMNLSSDDWPELGLTVLNDRRLSQVALLTAGGRWRALSAGVRKKGGRLHIAVPRPLPPLGMVTLRLS